jgi:hypothetical protein
LGLRGRDLVWIDHDFIDNRATQHDAGLMRQLHFLGLLVAVYDLAIINRGGGLRLRLSLRPWRGLRLSRLRGLGDVGLDSLFDVTDLSAKPSQKSITGLLVGHQSIVFDQSGKKTKKIRQIWI